MVSDSAEARPTSSDQLVEDHLHVVQHVVNQVSARYPRHVDREELWNAGALGLVDAARRYDPEAGTPFTRYAMIRIRGAIIDSTRSRDWATRALRRGMRDVRQAEERFAHTNGREASNDELAEQLGIDVERLESYRAAAVTACLLHLDQRVGSPDTDDTTLADLLEEHDREALPEETLEQRELIGTLRAAVTHLPDAQRRVIERYYFQGDYLKDIADTMGVTEARVSQIRSEALNAVRAFFATGFDGVREVDEAAPGRRARTAFVAQVAEQTTWRTRLEASDKRPREHVRLA